MLKADKLKEIVGRLRGDVDVVIGYKQGFDAIHASPCFVRSEAQVGDLIWSPLCVHNLATYLPGLKKKRTAIVVKGCDSRAVVQLLQEGLIKRENIVIIGIPCRGVVSTRKLSRAAEGEAIEEIAFDDDGSVRLKTARGEKRLSLADVTPDKCRSCQYPTPLVYDHLVGEPLAADKPAEAVYEDVKEIESKSLEERLAYWKAELGRCIRCYACRNACPMCVCQDSCIAESRDPHWMSQKATPDEKLMFHMIHTIHLAGRCVECGECERACPMGIPIGKLKKKINKEMKELFGYTSGVSPDDQPPMYTFNPDEKTIEEHKL